MIPRINAAALMASEPDAMAMAREAAMGVGFMTVYNTPISSRDVKDVIEAYAGFFHLPAAEKTDYDMAKTGSNRGWGAAGAEQVDPDANPDYKQVFDCGLTLVEDDPIAVKNLSFYAPNLWPEKPDGFADKLQSYYMQSTDLALDLLCKIATAAGEDGGYFRGKFSRPMALLRGNYYPQRPAWATSKDFGIATHTDYGCLTLLATDGSPGLEVRKRGGGWIPLSAPPGEFVINFGEMLEMWTAGKVKATPHRVIGTNAERVSVPLFFNPNHDANVAPVGSGKTIEAWAHLKKRYDETYVHLQKK